MVDSYWALEKAAVVDSIIIIMASHSKTLQRVLCGQADANLPFADLARLLEYLGFTMRTSGSHHIFTKPGLSERINIQSAGSKAKPYQVKQVRRILLDHPEIR